jgi:hypothetical protein
VASVMIVGKGTASAGTMTDPARADSSLAMCGSLLLTVPNARANPAF